MSTALTLNDYIGTARVDLLNTSKLTTGQTGQLVSALWDNANAQYQKQPRDHRVALTFSQSTSVAFQLSTYDVPPCDLPKMPYRSDGTWLLPALYAATHHLLYSPSAMRYELVLVLVDAVVLDADGVRNLLPEMRQRGVCVHVVVWGDGDFWLARDMARATGGSRHLVTSSVSDLAALLRRGVQ